MRLVKLITSFHNKYIVVTLIGKWLVVVGRLWAVGCL